MIRVFGVVCLIFLLTGTGAAREALWPGEEYDPSIPTIESVLGYKIGDKITLHADMQRYFEALMAAKPDQIRKFTYGKSWEGRELAYYALSTADTIAQLDQLAAGYQKLADPRKTNEAEAARLIEELPAALWLAYAVHGNEISGTDAAMMTAYHLLAATKDDRVGPILDNTLVWINPLQNPDGRDRFINRFRIAKGLEPDSDPISAEHNEPWPSGRTNHYLFDLNRDWIVMTQPETQGHVDALQRWYPQVFVDLHEMGSNSSYYFAPEAVPYNPHLIKSQRDRLFDFGKNNAQWFDRYGLPYFTRDVYDAFYPGYGASWPAYYGAVAMTYEQASARGLTYRRTIGSEFDYLDTIFGHFVTSLATAEVVAQNRREILQDFYTYNLTAIEEGRKADGEPRAYAFPDVGQDSKAQKLIKILKKQGIEVKTITDRTKACRTTLETDTLVIDAAQPRARMIRTLLNKQVDMDKDWVKEQERRRAKDYDHDIYDVTGWALPQMFNVTMRACDKLPANLADSSGDPSLGFTLDENAVAYLVDGRFGATESILAAAFRADLSVKIHTEEFGLEGKDYGRGTLIFPAAENKGRAGEIARIASANGAVVSSAKTSFVDWGRSLGGRAVISLVPPKIAMAWDDATYSYSAGNSRYVIERQIGYPVTVIRTSQLARANLSRYQVLILPEGFYDGDLGETGARMLKDWVSKGGVLIGQGRALRYLTGDKVGLLSAVRESQVREKPTTAPKKDKGRVPGLVIKSQDQLDSLITPGNESPDHMPGALVKAVTDPDHWITAGVKSDLIVLARGRDIYSPLRLDQGRNAVRFAATDDLVSSGYIWDENRKQLAFKPFLMVERRGRGMVIGFTHEPTVRAYLDGLRTLYGNALLVAPSVARPLR